jgi:hypothetical protein
MAGSESRWDLNQLQLGLRDLVRWYKTGPPGAKGFHIRQVWGVHPSREGPGRTLTSHRRRLAGEITGTDLWRELKLINQLGVTRGQLGR